MPFPKNFIWGAAAASYQIEGAAFEDGKGPSVWDMMCRHPGKIWRDQNGDVACDHYHRYREDVAIMREMGLKAYRFSISWPRVLPEGEGKPNAKGLEFYDRLIDELLQAGIAPWVTLFHWDYPYALYCRGGWLNEDSPEWFAKYAELLTDRFSDRVGHWMTLNEPACFLNLGHNVGIHAPGMLMAPKEVMRATHNSMLAHGRAAQVIRAKAKQKPLVGWAPCAGFAIPATDSPADVAAARAKMFEHCHGDSLPLNSYGWWNDPVFLGGYPEQMLSALGANAPDIKPGDLETIRQVPDFFGFNIYHGIRVKAGPDGKPVDVPFPDGYPLTAFHWSLTPEVLYWGPKFFYERYGKPIVVTENGMSNVDWISLDGKCHDPQRIDFLHRYLREYLRAAESGVETLGYMHWSIMDNFEWGCGYRERFGLVHVDYQTQKRTVKDSGRWYAEVIRANGENLR